MRGFAIITAAPEDDIRSRFPVRGILSGINKLIGPYKEESKNFNGCVGTEIRIPPGFERGKVRRACKIGIREYGYVVSKKYGINYNPLFHHSCLIRALDFLTITNGCDLRLGEVVIADAATYEGRNIFRILLPFARRIVLVTDNKSELIEEAKYAILNYGTSVAVVEDPVKASERADAVIMCSDKPHHSYIADINRPMLLLKFIKEPGGKCWFNNVTINFQNYNELSPTFAQGYVDIVKKKPLWINAENDGFRIESLRRGNISMLDRA